MENHTQVSEVFSYLSVIWCEIVRHVKRLEESGQMMLRSLFT